MATGDRLDPYSQYNFLIEIDGINRGAFTEASGLSAEQDVIDYREGSDDTVVRKLPGLKTFTNLVLKRGWTKDASLWDWRKTTIEGLTSRKSGSIIVLDEERAEALRFNFKEGWICKWEGPQLNSTTNEVAIESIEICHEGLEMDT